MLSKIDLDKSTVRAQLDVVKSKKVRQEYGNKDVFTDASENDGESSSDEDLSDGKVPNSVKDVPVEENSKHQSKPLL